MDVFVHNWAPGKAASLRLDADDLHAVNPSLVYAYASGWGTALGADPPPGVDFMVQAYSGIGELVPEPADVATGFARRLGAILATAPALTWRDALHTDGVPAAVVQRDLAALAADPRLARCFADHGCAVVTTPWRFS